jgi:hypothetical protein
MLRLGRVPESAYVHHRSVLAIRQRGDPLSLLLPNPAKTRRVSLSLHGLGRERRYKSGALSITTARPRALDYNKRSTVKVTLSEVASFSKTRGCAD